MWSKHGGRLRSFFLSYTSWTLFGDLGSKVFSVSFHPRTIGLWFLFHWKREIFWFANAFEHHSCLCAGYSHLHIAILAVLCIIIPSALKLWRSYECNNHILALQKDPTKALSKSIPRTLYEVWRYVCYIGLVPIVQVTRIVHGHQTRLSILREVTGRLKDCLNLLFTTGFVMQ